MAALTPAATTREDLARAYEYDVAQIKAEEAARVNRRTVRILLIRHAQSAANERPHEIGGRQNTAPLSSVGVRQAEALAARLKRIGTTFEHAYSSTAERAMHTARLSCAAIGYDVKNITTSELLLEQSQGGWERQDRANIYTKEVTHAMNTNNWEFKAPGVAPSDGVAGESQRDVETRFAQFVDTILAKSPVKDTAATAAVESSDAAKPIGEELKTNSIPTVAIFAHGFAIRCFLRGVLQSSPARTHKSSIDNTSITELVYTARSGGKGGWFLMRFNDASHLEGTELAGGKNGAE